MRHDGVLHQTDGGGSTECMVRAPLTFLKSEGFPIPKPSSLSELLIPLYFRCCPFLLLKSTTLDHSLYISNGSSPIQPLFFLFFEGKMSHQTFQDQPSWGWRPKSIQCSGVIFYHSSPHLYLPFSSPLSLVSFLNLDLDGFFFLLLNKFHPYKCMQGSSLTSSTFLQNRIL